MWGGVGGVAWWKWYVLSRTGRSLVQLLLSCGCLMHVVGEWMSSPPVAVWAVLLAFVCCAAFCLSWAMMGTVALL